MVRADHIGKNASNGTFSRHWQKIQATKIQKGSRGMIYDIFVYCNWVVTRWQYTFTHKQYIEQYKTNNT